MTTVYENQLAMNRERILQQIASEEQKADLARRRDDWGTVRIHAETINNLKNTLRVQVRIAEIKRKMADGTLKPSDLRYRGK